MMQALVDTPGLQGYEQVLDEGVIHEGHDGTYVDSQYEEHTAKKRRRLAGPRVPGLAEALIALLPGLDDKSFPEDIQDLGTRLRAALQLFEANPPPRLLDGMDGRRKAVSTRPKRGPVEGQISYHKKCNWPGGCVKNPSFGYPGQGRERCKEHKEPDMLNVIDKLCGIEGCRKRPSQGHPGGPATRCKKHAEPGQVNVANRRCIVDGCLQLPAFGIPGANLAIRCGEHAEPGMELVEKNCAAGGCSSHAAFGWPGGKPEVCKKHASIGMLDVKSKRCNFGGCAKHRSYGFPGQGRTRCRDHAEGGMIDLSR
ncbi:hypothetical protein KFL_002060250 [Klebsormidium nitens]|uniref:Uncharacterized protein n=1 Tax=Klebsormidium nitens TaxID=105231 RepID=A0A1Y1I1L1_KLENI|nr:hypothetical protein KFL_002060250 [Klebsormidium nitens]|eukprot:GAQ84804.1 hypothetical protein KFL_002060250 [Klebsormidium nitens]